MLAGLPLAVLDALPLWRVVLAALLLGVLLAGVVAGFSTGRAGGRLKLGLLLGLLVLALTLLAAVWAQRWPLHPAGQVEAEPARIRIWLVGTDAPRPAARPGGVVWR
jgi:hypothetical protein